jgi:hypothetical protein
MAGLGPAIHAFGPNGKKGVDGSTKCGHDALSAKVSAAGEGAHSGHAEIISAPSVRSPLPIRLGDEGH